MGFFDFLSKDNRAMKKLEKNIKRANNKHTPKEYRQAALYEVIESAKEGNERAIDGLIARLNINADPSIEDEKEKEWVCQALVDIGDKALPRIKKSMRNAESVNFIHRIFKKIVSEEEYRDELLNVLESFDTEYERNPDRKIQTIAALAEIEEEVVATALLRFLEDVNETVRFQTVISLFAQKNTLARESLLKVLCSDESLRVRNKVFEVFADTGWPTTGYKKQVLSLLPEGYRQDKSGKIIRLG